MKHESSLANLSASPPGGNVAKVTLRLEAVRGVAVLRVAALRVAGLRVTALRVAALLEADRRCCEASAAFFLNNSKFASKGICYQNNVEVR